MIFQGFESPPPGEISRTFILKIVKKLILTNIGNDSSDEDRQPIEQASANRSRRPKQQNYQASLPGTSMEQRQRDHSGRGTQSIDLSRADPCRQSSSMTQSRNSKHTSNHKRSISSSGKKKNVKY